MTPSPPLTVYRPKITDFLALDLRQSDDGESTCISIPPPSLVRNRNSWTADVGNMAFEVTVSPHESVRLCSYLLRFWSAEGLLASRASIDQVLLQGGLNPRVPPQVSALRVGPDVLQFLWAFILTTNNLPMVLEDVEGDIEDAPTAAADVRIIFGLEDPDMPPLEGSDDEQGG